LSLAMRDDNAANSYLRQGLVICDRDGIVSTRGFILSNLTEVALRAGDLRAAESHARNALDAATATGNRAVASWVRTKLARLESQRGDVGSARPILAEGLTAALELGLPSIKFDALRAFAELLLAQGEVPSARRVLAYAASHPKASAPARDEIQMCLERLPRGTQIEPLLDLDLDDLLHRVVAESKIAHAPLIATLRGAPIPASTAFQT
jgi:ATP/maltotriose-dependent transcriptional regulator MalT